MKREMRQNIIIALILSLILSVLAGKVETVAPVLFLIIGLLGITSGKTEQGKLLLAQLSLLFVIGFGGFSLAFYPNNLFGELCLIEAALFILRLFIAWAFSKPAVAHELSGAAGNQKGSG